MNTHPTPLRRPTARRVPALSAAIALFALARPAAAEIVPGILAPAIDSTASAGARPPTEEGLRGRFTLLEFVRTGCALCQRDVPRVNRIHAVFAPKGLRVLAVGYEAKPEVDRFVAQWGVQVPVAYGTIDAIRDYDVPSLPRIYVVDPAGRIAWVGTPTELKDEELDKVLATAPSLPETPATLADVGDLLAAERYAEADVRLAALLEQKTLSDADRKAAKAIRDWIAWYGAMALAGAEVDALEGRPHDAVRTLEHLVVAYGETETGKAAREKAKAMREDEELQPTLRAHEALSKARVEAKTLPLKDRLPLFRKVFEQAEDPAIRERARVHMNDIEAEIRRQSGT